MKLRALRKWKEHGDTRDSLPQVTDGQMCASRDVLFFLGKARAEPGTAMAATAREALPPHC